MEVVGGPVLIPYVVSNASAKSRCNDDTYIHVDCLYFACSDVWKIHLFEGGRMISVRTAVWRRSVKAWKFGVFKAWFVDYSSPGVHFHTKSKDLPNNYRFVEEACDDCIIVVFDRRWSLNVLPDLPSLLLGLPYRVVSPLCVSTPPLPDMPPAKSDCCVHGSGTPSSGFISLLLGWVVSVGVLLFFSKLLLYETFCSLHIFRIFACT